MMRSFFLVCLLLFFAAQQSRCFSSVRLMSRESSVLSKGQRLYDHGRGIIIAGTPATRTSLQSATQDEETKQEDPSFQQQSNKSSATLRRELGSQELLMLPRQYKVGDSPPHFPQMNHVSCAVVSGGNLPLDRLDSTIQRAMELHPLLNARVVGDGEPRKRIDLFQMVREGDPNPCTFVSSSSSTFSTGQILTVVDLPSGSSRGDFDRSWKSSFQKLLDDGSWCSPSDGPLWKIELHQMKEQKTFALLFAFNHAISDQSSANRLIDFILTDVQSNGQTKWRKQTSIPVSMEESVLGQGKEWKQQGGKDFSLNTIKYVAGKAFEGIKNPVILPESISTESKSNPITGALSTISGKAAGGKDSTAEERQSSVQFRSLSQERTSALLQRCRQEGVSMSNALTAAATFTASDFVGKSEKVKSRYYKVLQSLDMRRFGERYDKGESVGCMAGSMDLMLGPVSDGSGRQFSKDRSPKKTREFWDLARESKTQTEAFVKNRGPQEATRVFDFAMTISDMNNLVYLTSNSEDTKGRAYSAGVTNAGVFEKLPSFPKEGEQPQYTISGNYGSYKVEDVFYATTHVRSGCLFPLSAITVDGSLKLTFNPVSPIISDVECSAFADAMVELLDSASEGSKPDLLSGVSSNALSLTAAAVGSAAVASHASAYNDFFQSLLTMKINIPDDADFWAAFNFWVFFAVLHPLLQPILAISEVLHASPGPSIADLIPVTFAAGNLLVIALLSRFKDFRNAANIAALSAFFAYVGAGLDGQAGFGDFNLALDDSYKGRTVRGCPAYEEVRQPSMNNFDLQKYQGLWCKWHTVPSPLCPYCYFLTSFQMSKSSMTGPSSKRFMIQR